MYIIRERLLDKKIWNIVISKPDEAHVLVSKMLRTNMELIREDYILSKDSNQEYSSDEMSVTLYKDSARITFPDDQVVALKLRNRSRSSYNSIRNTLLENRIWWTNEHQRTEFELRSDSLCYIWKNFEKAPYDSSKWFLFKINDECFLTFTDSRYSIPRVRMKGKQLIETDCWRHECRDSTLPLKEK